jgi:hypothetical protein
MLERVPAAEPTTMSGDNEVKCPYDDESRRRMFINEYSRRTRYPSPSACWTSKHYRSMFVELASVRGVQLWYHVAVDISCDLVMCLPRDILHCANMILLEMSFVCRVMNG